jgi:hypothetical protein
MAVSAKNRTMTETSELKCRYRESHSKLSDCAFSLVDLPKEVSVADLLH